MRRGTEKEHQKKKVVFDVPYKILERLNPGIDTPGKCAKMNSRNSKYTK